MQRRRINLAGIIIMLLPFVLLFFLLNGTGSGKGQTISYSYALEQIRDTVKNGNRVLRVCIDNEEIYLLTTKERQADFPARYYDYVTQGDAAAFIDDVKSIVSQVKEKPFAEVSALDYGFDIAYQYT